MARIVVLLLLFPTLVSAYPAPKADSMPPFAGRWCVMHWGYNEQHVLFAEGGNYYCREYADGKWRAYRTGNGWHVTFNEGNSRYGLLIHDDHMIGGSGEDSEEWSTPVRFGE